MMALEILYQNFDLNGVQFGIELTADHCGLTACRLLMDHEVPAAGKNHSERNSTKHLMRAFQAIQDYLDRKATTLDAHLAPDGTPFQRDVWKATREIPFGEVRSYGWVAGEIGNPKAMRAVAQALAANPLLLFVPCHRVVRGNGDIGGFACGTEWKRRLLSLEGVSDPKILKAVCQA